MVETKFLLVGSGLVAGIMMSSALDRAPDGPLFAPRPATANVAVVSAGRPVDRLPLRHGQQTRFSRARDGLFYVHAMVNGVPVRFVLDTGATLVVLTADDAKRVGLTATGGSLDRMETAGGASAVQRVTINHIKVAGHAIEDVDAAVVDHGLQTSLLGQNLLAQLGPITLSSDEVALQ